MTLSAKSVKTITEVSNNNGPTADSAAQPPSAGLKMILQPPKYKTIQHIILKEQVDSFVPFTPETCGTAMIVVDISEKSKELQG